MAKKFDRAGFDKGQRWFSTQEYHAALQAALAVVDLEKRIKEIRLDESVPPHVFDDLCRQASDAIKRCEELGLTKD